MNTTNTRIYFYIHIQHNMGMGKDLCQGKDILLVIIHPFLGVRVSPAIQQQDQQLLWK
jgi:hypothetical protein